MPGLAVKDGVREGHAVERRTSHRL